MISSAIDEPLCDLTDAVARVRAMASAAGESARGAAICATFRAADSLMAAGIEMLSQGGLEAESGLPTEMLLMLSARRMGSEARMLTHAAATMPQMPKLAWLFDSGVISWGQVRAIVSAVSRLPAGARAEVDALIASHADQLAFSDPDRLVQMVDDEVDRRRPELLLAREDRAVEGGFLMIQPRLDSQGGSFYGEADSEGLDTLTRALDAAAKRPRNAEDEDAPTRAQQRYDALIGVCENWLGGRTGGAESTRPRPRILATLDVTQLAKGDQADAMRLLWNLAGRVGKLSHVSREAILCDPEVVPIIFNGPQPIAVGEAAKLIAPKVRTAVIARDGACRFPGCGAPAGWTDVHHIVPGFGNQVEHLVLLCRRCHRRVHRRRWRMRWLEDGGLLFERRGRQDTSYPKHRRLPTPRE